MVRSLWTAATGMTAQQTNLDVIANNLSNVNTTGYKTQVNEFKTLLYQTIQTRTTSANGEQKPVSAQVGLGVRNASITSIFTTGNIVASTSTSAFAINGNGFFSVQGEDGNPFFTKDGNFRWTLSTNGGSMLSDTSGHPVLSTTGNPIVLNQTYTLSEIDIDADGQLYYPDANNVPQALGIQIGVFQFSNPAGLERQGDNLFAQTAASGQPINESTNNQVEKSQLLQGYLEASNVQVADEMVNMIVTQRAYELNSKAITASDEMLQQANNLRR
ncbi:MAG: flagellar hook-basal body protein [Lachnospiraceae bacterium]|jgi:flagellar basal-body rod protein FlgG|nr:flagellar hook-basal body protein [Lachnospiraceae bacterium]